MASTLMELMRPEVERYAEDYYVLQLLEGIEGLVGKDSETNSANISVDESSGRKLTPLVGGLVFI